MNVPFFNISIFFWCCDCGALMQISEYEKELEEMTSMSQDEWIQCLRRYIHTFEH